jgi:hypothetical protein
MPVHADLREEVVDLVARAGETGVDLRVTGGVAVALLCPSAAQPPLQRPFKDLDLVGRAKQRGQIEAVMTARGYAAESRFNLLQGSTQLMFTDPDTGRQIDVFLDKLSMCHELPLARRLTLYDVTLSPTDLLLSKLQIVEATDKDLQDVLALLLDGQIDVDYVAELLAGDWGWWRTSQGTLDKAEAFAAGMLDAPALERVRQAIAGLRAAIEAAPKSMRWKTRARIGERKRWYELPEDTR